MKKQTTFCQKLLFMAFHEQHQPAHREVLKNNITDNGNIFIVSLINRIAVDLRNH